MLRIAVALLPCCERPLAEGARRARLRVALRPREYLSLLISASDALTPRASRAVRISLTEAFGCCFIMSRMTSLLRAVTTAVFLRANLLSPVVSILRTNQEHTLS